MKRYKALEVFIHDRKVGTLAMMREGTVAFEYDRQWLQDGYAISPYSLPLEEKVFIPRYDPFEGLFGVFDDSLPDGWGRLLTDRLLLKNGENPYEIDCLNRLSIVGDSGMGVLSYHPVHDLGEAGEILDYDRMARECKKVLETDFSEDLDELFRLGGSSGGARPKIFTKYNGEEWIVKFPSSIDKEDCGEVEYRYALCAKKCGLDMADVRLFPSERCAGYFGTKRFDRVRGKDGNMQRVHMLSVSGMLETSHRIPNLDYHLLMRLTLSLTKDYRQVEQMFRQMCFNVFAHNRDDHSRNFSFLYDEIDRRWKLSPVYDLTYSNSLGGEHATCVDGNGKNPGMKEILSVAVKIGLAQDKSKRIAETIHEIIEQELGDILKR